MRQPVQILVYSVRRGRDDWEYLMLHRLPRRGDFWQGTSGGVEAGESPVEAAHRELLEETGLLPERLIDIVYTYTFPLEERYRHLYAPDVQQIREHAFLAIVPADAVPTLDPREHDAWRWCGFEEALSLSPWPESREALRRADAVLRSQDGGRQMEDGRRRP